MKIIGLIIFVAGGLMLAGGMSTAKQLSIPGMAIAILGYPLLLAIAWGWMALNSIVSLRQRAKRAWSNIEVELKRRADLLPNLAAMVKAARMHDKDTQQVIAILRAKASIAPAQSRAPEAYPSISAQPNFLAIQQELSNTEARIALARSYDNGIATAFNARLPVVPDRFLVAIARLKPFDLFNATDLVRETPRVNFVEKAQ